MMRYNPLSFIVGLILLPALAIAHQDDIQLLKTLHVQKAQLNSTKGSVVTQRTSVRNAAAPMVQLAQADVPAGSGQELQHNYLKSIAENAIRSSAENALRKPVQTADSNPGSETPLPTPISSQEKKRVDKIRSIVSEAVSDAPPGQSDEPMLEPVGQTPKTSSPQQRRQQLRKVIVDAPPAKDEASKGYLSKLQDEVSTTVVIDEESARRTAAPATDTAGSSEAGGGITAAESLVEGDGTYLYTVRAGDSLWMIAQHFYRDGHRYVELFQANQALLDNADLLTVGQVLRVPNAEVKD